MVRANSISMDLYFVALEFMGMVDTMVSGLLGMRDGRTEQLQLAARIIPYHIAEGSGYKTTDNGVQSYARALRSATECASILRECGTLEERDGTSLERSRELLLKLISMLNRILFRQGQRQQEQSRPLPS